MTILGLEDCDHRIMAAATLTMLIGHDSVQMLAERRQGRTLQQIATPRGISRAAVAQRLETAEAKADQVKALYQRLIEAQSRVQPTGAGRAVA